MTEWVRIKRILLLLLILIVSGAGTAKGDQAAVSNMVVSTTGQNLILSFELENAFTEKIVEALESGVKISFSLPVKVYRKRNFWPDKKVAEKNLIHTIKYDALKKEYQVNRSWVPDKPLTVQNFDEAAGAMNQVDGLVLISLDRLEKGAFYKTKAKAKLDRLSLPYYLKYFLFFISFWEFETDWGVIDFQH